MKIPCYEESASARNVWSSVFFVFFCKLCSNRSLAGDHVTSRSVFRILSRALGMRDSDGRTKETEGLVALLTLLVVLLSFKRSESSECVAYPQNAPLGPCLRREQKTIATGRSNSGFKFVCYTRYSAVSLMSVDW